MFAPLPIALLALLTVAEPPALLLELRADDVESLRIALAARDGQPALELELPGDDASVQSLVVLLLEAEPAEDHRCSDAGSLRFRLRDGRTVRVGLLPSHLDGRYELRLWDGERVTATVGVDRRALFARLEALGLPMDHPSLRR